jgi:hypothetical protein
LLKYLPEEMSEEKLSLGLCGVEGCSSALLTSILVSNEDGSLMRVKVCHAHLARVRWCQTCLNYDENSAECKALPPRRRSERSKASDRALMNPNDWCGHWTQKEPVTLKIVRGEEDVEFSDIHTLIDIRNRGKSDPL